MVLLHLKEILMLVCLKILVIFLICGDESVKVVHFVCVCWEVWVWRVLSGRCFFVFWVWVRLTCLPVFWPTWHLHAPTRITSHTTSNHTDPRTITQHPPTFHPTPPPLDYTATAGTLPTNTQTTRNYTHITRYVHCSLICLYTSLFSLCCRLTTTHGFIQSVLLMMGIMMPETCWKLTNCE